MTEKLKKIPAPKTSKKKKPEETVSKNKALTMGDLLKQDTVQPPKKGKIVSGKIISLTKKGLYLI